MPINQYMTFDCLELIENNETILQGNKLEIKKKNDVIKLIFGEKYYQKILSKIKKFKFIPSWCRSNRL